MFQDFFLRDVFVVQSHFSFRSRSNDGFREFLVFAHSVRQLHAANFAYTAFVSTPCATTQVTAYNHFYRKTFTQYAYRYHWVRSSHFPVRTDVSSGIKEFSCNLVQHLSFVRNTFRKYYVKGRNTVGCYHDEFFAVDVVHIAHFSVVHAFLSRKVEICFC